LPIAQTSVDYLNLLLTSNAAGLTASEAPQFFREHVSRDAASHALQRLFKKRCAWRKKDGLENRYYITLNGIKKLAHLQKKEKHDK